MRGSRRPVQSRHGEKTWVVFVRVTQGWFLPFPRHSLGHCLNWQTLIPWDCIFTKPPRPEKQQQLSWLDRFGVAAPTGMRDPGVPQGTRWKIQRLNTMTDFLYSTSWHSWI